MAMSFLQICCIFLLLQICCSVDFDYFKTYNEYFEDSSKEVNTTVDARRAGDKTRKSAKHTTETTTPSTVEADDDEEDDNITIYLPTKRNSRHKGTSAPVNVINMTTPESKQLSTLISETNLTIETATRNIFKNIEYDDDYDDDVTVRQSDTLRQQHDEINLTMLEPDDIKQINDSKNIYNDFYSLEPAARQYDYKGQAINIPKHYNTWYVPERYPCWELPLIYGVLTKQKSIDEVFLIRPLKLKHVIDSHDGQETLSRLQPVDTYILNKWCGTPPCYGDHTLCLYPHKTMSNVCELQYEVKSPTMLEQIELVNTINSMRNHVAKGLPGQYPFLPPAANMKQMIYDHDLEQMSEAWLRQCLPGPAPCSAIDFGFVSQLECTKYAELCCLNSEVKCIPRQECFVNPIIGCIHTWFWSAGDDLSETDVKCGHVESSTYSTVQLLWANTNKIGCAYGQKTNGDVRVVCNFSPGAPFKLDIRYFCGILGHKDITHSLSSFVPSIEIPDITDLDFLAAIGVNLEKYRRKHKYIDVSAIDLLNKKQVINNVTNNWGVVSLSKIYPEGWVRHQLKDDSNGTKGLVARLVTRYKFTEDTQARCDEEEPIYAIGDPGSACLETGRKFYALCYEFRDPSPGYRLVAVLAPVALFTLILYDLFSGVMRQTNYY